MTSRAFASSPVTWVVVLAALLLAVWLGWPYLQRDGVPRPAPVAEAPPPVPEPAETGQDATVAAPEGPLHPIEPEAEAGEGEALRASTHNLDDSDPLVREQLAALLSRKDVLEFFQLDGLVRRIVVTVDNLGRAHAPARLWPVHPTPGRFTTHKAADGREFIDPDNSQRYDAWVRMVESVDVGRAVQAYRRLYPLFQKAYEELGYPGRYFNDRLVEVLDQLIATPVHDEPLEVTLVQVKGPVPSLRPWVRYEFADPALASLSSGQRMLLRMGPAHQRRLQARLRQVRELVD